MLFRSDRKSTRLNSSHTIISYAVFCLKKKKRLLRAPRLSPHQRPLVRTLSGAPARPRPAGGTGGGDTRRAAWGGLPTVRFFFNDPPPPRFHPLSLPPVLPF